MPLAVRLRQNRAEPHGILWVRRPAKAWLPAGLPARPVLRARPWRRRSQGAAAGYLRAHSYNFVYSLGVRVWAGSARRHCFARGERHVVVAPEHRQNAPVRRRLRPPAPLAPASAASGRRPQQLQPDEKRDRRVGRVAQPHRCPPDPPRSRRGASPALPPLVRGPVRGLVFGMFRGQVRGHVRGQNGGLQPGGR